MTKTVAIAALATLIGCGGAHAGIYDDWASRGPNARYSDYASRCYDAIKPSAMNPNGDAAFYIMSAVGALKCHLDDPAVSVDDDLSNAPMTCTDPTARKARESAADYLARSRH